MKAFTAVLIAVAILYVDSEYNDGRYTRVIKQAATSLVGHQETQRRNDA